MWSIAPFTRGISLKLTTIVSTLYTTFKSCKSTAKRSSPQSCPLPTPSTYIAARRLGGATLSSHLTINQRHLGADHSGRLGLIDTQTRPGSGPVPWTGMFPSQSAQALVKFNQPISPGLDNNGWQASHTYYVGLRCPETWPRGHAPLRVW